jgi:hypothetical protein
MPDTMHMTIVRKKTKESRAKVIEIGREAAFRIRAYCASANPKPGKNPNVARRIASSNTISSK